MVLFPSLFLWAGEECSVFVLKRYRQVQRVAAADLAPDVARLGSLGHRMSVTWMFRLLPDPSFSMGFLCSRVDVQELACFNTRAEREFGMAVRNEVHESGPKSPSH
ncbi:hypothetical protein IP76_09920 [Rhizobium sp. AAP43]|nr:hypothetical protein IP76_09920 [Rhizobium sp. AAP43]